MLRTILEELRTRIAALEKEMINIKWIASETLKIAEANEQRDATQKVKQVAKIKKVTKSVDSTMPEDVYIQRRRRDIRV